MKDSIDLRDRTISATSSVASSASSSSSSSASVGGIQLLSPSLQRSMKAEAARNTIVRPLPAASLATVNDSNNSRCAATAKGVVDFDFNNFTLESVRSTMQSSSNNKSNSSNSNSNNNNNNNNNRNNNNRNMRPHTTSSDDSNMGLSSKAEMFADALDAQSGPEGTYSFHTMRSTEDFDAVLDHRRRNPSTASSSNIAAAVVPTTLPDDVTALSATLQRIHTASIAAADAAASRRKRTTVVMAGWLQKRKGVVLKRWRASYCLLRDDDNLCVYANEDTVNGRVEQRVQILRVLLSDRSDAFHVIGVGVDGTPRKDEFRALHSVDWCRWFRAFRGYLDAVSLDGVLARKPELLDLSTASAYSTDQRASDDNSTCISTSTASVPVPVVLWHGTNTDVGISISTKQTGPPSRTHSVRGSFDGSSDDNVAASRATVSSFSWTHRNSFDYKVEPTDCPMTIEPHAPILGGGSSSSSSSDIHNATQMQQSMRLRASDSTVSRDSNSGKALLFSW